MWSFYGHLHYNLCDVFKPSKNIYDSFELCLPYFSHLLQQEHIASECRVWLRKSKSVICIIFKIFHYLVCVYVCVRVYYGVLVEIKGQLAGLCSLFLLYGAQGWNSSHQTWQYVPLPAEPSCQPLL